MALLTAIIPHLAEVAKPGRGSLPPFQGNRVAGALAPTDRTSERPMSSGVYLGVWSAAKRFSSAAEPSEVLNGGSTCCAVSCLLQSAAERTRTLSRLASTRGCSDPTLCQSSKLLFASSCPPLPLLVVLRLLVSRPLLFPSFVFPCFDYTIFINQSQGGA